MKPENAEKLGLLADKIDNLVAGLELPMAPDFHLEQLKQILPDISKGMKEIHIEETGENPWV